MSSPAVQSILVLLGGDVRGNPAQFMMERLFAHHDLDWRYVTVEVEPDALADAVRGVRAMGFHGAHIGAPYSSSIGPLVDALGDVAQRCGRVNLLRREDRRLVGENTEGRAIVSALTRLVELAGRSCVLLGAGGPATAAALELAAAGAAQIAVIDRDESAARQLASLLAGLGSVAATAIGWSEPVEPPAETDLILRVGPVPPSPRGGETPLKPGALRPEMIVADVSLDPPASPLIEQAREATCRVLDGLEILVEQMAVDYQLWTGRQSDRDVLREAAEEFFGF